MINILESIPIELKTEFFKSLKNSVQDIIELHSRSAQPERPIALDNGDKILSYFFMPTGKGIFYQDVFFYFEISSPQPITLQFLQ